MIQVRLSEVMAKKDWRLTDLAKELDMTIANLSNIKNGHSKAIRFDTLEKLCKALDCQPGDLITYERQVEDER